MKLTDEDSYLGYINAITSDFSVISETVYINLLNSSEYKNYIRLATEEAKSELEMKITAWKGKIDEVTSKISADELQEENNKKMVLSLLNKYTWKKVLDILEVNELEDSLYTKYNRSLKDEDVWIKHTVAIEHDEFSNY